MPLGIELAAARTRTLPVSEIAAELARGLDVLATTMRDAPARHRSMAASFDASWRLLSCPVSASILRQASVFRGGFTTEAAGAVTGATLTDLEGLVDSCWLRLEAGGRWGMHELIRQYCEAKLRTEHPAETGEDEAERSRRGMSLTSDGLSRRSMRRFQVRPEALSEIEPDFGNLLAAWEGFSDSRRSRADATGHAGVRGDGAIAWCGGRSLLAARGAEHPAASRCSWRMAMA